MTGYEPRYPQTMHDPAPYRVSLKRWLRRTLGANKTMVETQMGGFASVASISLSASPRELTPRRRRAFLTCVRTV